MTFLGFDSFPGPTQFTFLATILQWVNVTNPLKLLLLGSIVESGRRLCQWLMERVRFQYCITASFSEGDPSYEWILHYLTEKQFWRQSREFKVNSKTLKRRWTVKASPGVSIEDKNVDYVPTFEKPQLFRWGGYWVEIYRSQSYVSSKGDVGVLHLTIYTLNMGVLEKLIAEARSVYHEINRPHVSIHTTDSSLSYTTEHDWSNVKHKLRRPLGSLALPNGALDSLLDDTKMFLQSEQWYQDMGIPYRRGYLLYGPPGTGKSSTIFSLAGELGLEIYTLSLASKNVDDSFLSRVSASLPKNSIFLIEDIDCAFPTRQASDGDSDSDSDSDDGHTPNTSYGRDNITLSGLLNVIDGVGSEEGRLFFATTNYIERLDSAFLRPGRIDLKVEYFLSNPDQASALFRRFFPGAPDGVSEVFAARVPKTQFSTAELQGYLLLHRRDMQRALDCVEEWVAKELGERREKEEKEEKRKEKQRQKKKSQQQEAILAAAGAIAIATASLSPGSDEKKPEEQAGCEGKVIEVNVELPPQEQMGANEQELQAPKETPVVQQDEGTATPPASISADDIGSENESSRSHWS